MGNFKILHHLDHLKDLKAAAHPVPISIRLVLSDLCNQNCHFCTFRMEDSFTNRLFKGLDKKGNLTYNPTRFFDKEKACEIISDAKEMGVKSIEFTGGGEPTVHPHHVEIFQAALNSGLDLGLITNGVLCRSKLIDALMEANWCRFSIDAGNKDTYSQLREVPSRIYGVVINNIKDLVRKKRQRGSKITIGTSFIVTDKNYLEVYECARRMSELGVDYFRVGYYRADEGFVAGDFEKTQELINKSIVDFNRDDFSVVNEYAESSKNMDGPPDYNFCAYQHVNTWIAADYNVYRCCVTSYDKHGLIGSIRDQSFKKLWFSDLKRKKMDEFNAMSCTQCIYNDKNKILNYAIRQDPDHVNFI